MSKTVSAIKKWARLQPQATAIKGQKESISYLELYTAVCAFKEYLEQQNPKVLGILADNSPAWILIDLAAQAANIPVLPIPGFFSEQQIRHAMEDTGCDFILTDQPEVFGQFYKHTPQQNKHLSSLSNNNSLIWEILITPGKQSKVTSNTAKVTYTSGTTGNPKGVCLTQTAIDRVAMSLYETVGMHTRERHLCALPLATLLENIAGVYVPLLAGAQCIAYPMEKTGLRGASEFNARQYHYALVETEASTTVVVPHLLQKLVEFCEQTGITFSCLRFMAVGGAPVSVELLERAQLCDIPVYEGYGLSECASVVTVNNQQQHRTGSVGKPLPHIKMKFADDGEILIKGALYSGYLGQALHNSDYFATGDIGSLDNDGYLHIRGRKKNMFITAFGRNVSPEWVERELVLEPAISQAAVFGEGRPWNVALIVPATGSTNADINRSIEKLNKKLPDYARVGAWITTTEPFQLKNQQVTATGRLRRKIIWQQYASQIEKLYSRNDTYRKLA